MHNNIMAAGQPVTDESPEVLERTAVETFLNISPENKAHYDAEEEAIHFLLTGIGDEIYSTVDACKTTHDISYVPIPVKTSLQTDLMRTTRYKGKEIAKLITLPSESASKEDNKLRKVIRTKAEQSDGLEDTDEEIDKQELEAHYSFMAKIQEVLPADSGSDAKAIGKVETDDSNVIPDSSNMCDNDK
ncbi:hypothetical protein Tco_1027458 [Tanacetum coccineum]